MITETELRAMSTTDLVAYWVGCPRTEETIVCRELDRRVDLGDLEAIIF